MTPREPIRDNARQRAREHLQRGDALGWFEALYAAADGNPDVIPWADLAPNPTLARWLDSRDVEADSKSALVVGCGLGDDAEELARRGFEVTAFDVSETAIAWCRRRFPDSKVRFMVADLFEAPESWRPGFDFVFEAYTLQVLPADLRRKAMDEMASFVAPGGTLLVNCRGRDAEEPCGEIPWPLAKDELARFQQLGLDQVSFEDFWDDEDPPVRRFLVEYRLPQQL